MNSIEELNQSRYTTKAEWMADMADSRHDTDEAFRNAVDNKLRRSFSNMTGVQQAQTAPQAMSVQTWADGSIAVGSAGDVAKARIDIVNQSNAATKQSTDQFQKFRSVQVKR